MECSTALPRRGYAHRTSGIRWRLEESKICKSYLDLSRRIRASERRLQALEETLEQILLMLEQNLRRFLDRLWF